MVDNSVSYAIADFVLKHVYDTEVHVRGILNLETSFYKPPGCGSPI